MMEHEVESYDKCPHCGGGQFGYDSRYFDNRKIHVKFTCPDCGTVYVETYEYKHTRYESDEPDKRYRVSLRYEGVEDGWDQYFDDAHAALDFYRRSGNAQETLENRCTLAAERFDHGEWKTVFKREVSGSLF